MLRRPLAAALAAALALAASPASALTALFTGLTFGPGATLDGVDVSGLGFAISAPIDPAAPASPSVFATEATFLIGATSATTAPGAAFVFLEDSGGAFRVGFLSFEPVGGAVGFAWESLAVPAGFDAGALGPLGPVTLAFADDAPITLATDAGPLFIAGIEETPLTFELRAAAPDAAIPLPPAAALLAFGAAALAGLRRRAARA